MGTDRILQSLLGGGASSAFAGGLAGGLASGLLTSKSGRKLGKKALKLGAVAAVGGLAYSAWSRYQQSQSAGSAEPTSIDRFLPPPDRSASVDALGLTLLRAMVAAARADGRLDGKERAAIEVRIANLDLAEADREALRAELAQPVDLEALVASATTPEIASEIYTASLLAIDPDTAAERAWLAMLAARLELPEALVGSIHHELGADVAARGGPSDAPRLPA